MSEFNRSQTFHKVWKTTHKFENNFQKLSELRPVKVAVLKLPLSATGSPLRVWSSFLRRPETLFMAILELSRVDYPRNRLIFVSRTTSEKSYGCVLNFWSKMVFVESTRLLEEFRYRFKIPSKSCSRDVLRGLPFDFLLISPFCTLIDPNYATKCQFLAFFGHFLKL